MTKEKQLFMQIGSTKIYRDGSVLLKEVSWMFGDNVATVNIDETEKALEQIKTTGSWQGTNFRDQAHLIHALKIASVVKRPDIQNLIKDWEDQRDKADLMFKQMHEKIESEASLIQ